MAFAWEAPIYPPGAARPGALHRPGTGALTCTRGLGRAVSTTSGSSMLNVLLARPRRGPRLGSLLESRFHIAGQGKPRARAAAPLTSRSPRFLVLLVRGGLRGGPGTHFSFRFSHEPKGNSTCERRKPIFKISQRKREGLPDRLGDARREPRALPPRPALQQPGPRPRRAGHEATGGVQGPGRFFLDMLGGGVGQS